MGEQCTRIGIRLTPTAKKALEYVAEYQEMSVSQLVRACINICLCADPTILKGWFESITPSHDDDLLPPLDDTEEWRKILASN